MEYRKKIPLLAYAEKKNGKSYIFSIICSGHDDDEGQVGPTHTTCQIRLSFISKLSISFEKYI